MRLTAITLFVAAGLYGLVLLALFAFQQRLMFIPERLPANFRFQLVGPFEERWIVSDGQRLHTLFFPVPRAPGTIVYFHGNAGSLAGWGPVGEQLSAKTGYNVWMLDYPGYGKSEGGLASEDGLRKAAAAIYEAAKLQEHGDEKKIIVYGRSIGTGFAIRLAAVQKPGGLVLESPYDSMKSLAGELFRWAPAFLVRYPIRSDLDAPLVHCPTLLIHGEQDEVIPFHQGEQLASRIPGVTFVPIPSGRHNDLNSFSAYWTNLDAFLARQR
jgi:uncharacterized protein